MSGMYVSVKIHVLKLWYVLKSVIFNLFIIIFLECSETFARFTTVDPKIHFMESKKFIHSLYPKWLEYRSLRLLRY